MGLVSENETESVHLATLNSDQKFGGDGDKISAAKDFDDVLEIVGSAGKYQRFLLYAVLVPFSIFEGILGIGLFLLDEPNHWCHVGGREPGVDLETWKNLTIPRNANGELSKCSMYDNMTLLGNGSSLPPTIDCTSGWEYDFSVTNYRSILVEYNWVCDKSHYATWVFTASNAGRTVGTFLLGLLSDKIGRKPVFIITLVLLTFGRAAALYFAENILMFTAFGFVTGFSSPMFAITNNTIAVELSGKEYRAWIYSFTWMTVVIGIVAVPALVLITPTWVIFGWTCILLGSVSYLLLPWLPESPRWLLSQGKVDEVIAILRKVASWNGTGDRISDSELRRLLASIVASTPEGSGEDSFSKNVLKLFSSATMALRTFLIIFVWIMNAIVSDVLNLNSLTLHGHRLLNYTLISLMEIPGGFFGGILANKWGRRWMQVAFFLLVGLCCCAAGYCSLFVGGTAGEGYATGVIIASNVAKFAATMSFLVIYLQSVELFPTPVRTTGTGLASTTSSFAIILVPFIVFTGKTGSRTTPWVVSTVMSFLGMIAAACIPETMNYKLPESIEEAEEFGKGRKFWSFSLPKRSDDKTTT